MSRSKVVANSHRSGFAGREGPLQDSRDTARWDELDAILNGADDASPNERGGAEGQQDVDKSQRSRWQGTGAEDGNKTDALGIDSEVKVRKPRAPTAKLDEERLLSTKGIPKLRRITKERLKFKGKGHEFSDVTRLLNLYQLWLDDMFPKANFADGLAMIEKLGHKKRLQIMRREWIDESKNIHRIGEEEIEERDAARLEAVVESNAQQEAAAQVALEERQQESRRREDEDMDEQPEEDELDALLAQEGQVQPAAASRALQTDDYREARDELDDMDALEAMGDDW